jgi:hypothetical protein
MSDAELEAIVEWDGQAGDLVKVLVETHWLDRVEGPVRLYVHDWHHHADESVHRKLARERRFFANGEPPNTNYLPQRERPEAVRFYSENAASSLISRDRVVIDRDAKSSGQAQAQAQGQEQGPGAGAEAAAPRAARSNGSRRGTTAAPEGAGDLGEVAAAALEHFEQLGALGGAAGGADLGEVRRAAHRPTTQA